MDDQIFGTCAGFVGTSPTSTTGCAEMLGITKVDQSIEAGDGFKNNVAAFAPVTPIGAAIFNIFFMAERDRTGATSTGAKIDFCLIEKLHGVTDYKENRACLKA